MDFPTLLEDLGGKESYLEWTSTKDAQTWFREAFTSPRVAYLIKPLWESLKERELDEKLEKLAVDALEHRSFDYVKEYIRSYIHPTDHSLPEEQDGRMLVELTWLVGSYALVLGIDVTLAMSFKDPYVGSAARELYGYLTDCDKRYRSPPDEPEVYGKFCSIVQSSGTGKSRTIIELMRGKVLGLYINLRSQKEENSYPPRDEIPTEILTQNLEVPAEEYSDRCVAFFTAIFTVITRHLHPVSKSEPTPVEDILLWSSRMCDFESGYRKRFFQEVKKEYYKALKKITPKGPLPSGSEPLETAIQDLAVADTGIDPPVDTEPVAPLMKLSLSDEGDKSKAGKKSEESNKGNDKESNKSNEDVTRKLELRGESALRRAYRQLIQTLPGFFVHNSHEPKLVIAFDEAHMIGEPQDYYQPSHILCRVISGFSRLQATISNWVIFASTTSRVADFSVPAHINPSLRISQGGEALYPPFSAFGWDQLATPLSNLDPRDISRLRHVMGFGRPLWKSTAPALGSVIQVLDTASKKLCNSTSFNPTDASQVFAVLGQRFCLDICFGHSKAVKFQQKAISSHLRICCATTSDRIWQDTIYPSEPLLSCAAAELLHSVVRTDQRETKLPLAIGCLTSSMQDGLVEIGKKGELVSRILYLVTKDVLARKIEAQLHRTAETDEQWMEAELVDCKPLRVVDYLTFLFGEKVITTAGHEFDGWYINFSHWICMKSVIKTDDESTLRTALMRHWARSCAVQCCHNQPIIDKLIPMYKSTPGAEPEHCMSYIIISDWARLEATKPSLNSMTPGNLGIPDLGHPYIAILADLRVSKGSVTFSMTGKKRSSKALRIYAPGINSDTYSCFQDTQLLPIEDKLRVMLDVTKDAWYEPSSTFLRRIGYGEMMDDEHLNWEVQD